MANIRSNVTNQDYFNRLADANCKYVLMSVESGNDYIRNEVMKRGISRQKMFDSFEWANKAGIQTNANCIIGLPFETPEMIEDSISTIAQLGATDYGINIFYPYKGTELRKICEDNGFMPDTLGVEANDVATVKERTESILNLPTISKDQIVYYQDNWEDLIIRKKGFKSRNARRIRNAYGDFFYKKNRLPMVRSFLESSGLAISTRKALSKIIGQ